MSHPLFTICTNINFLNEWNNYWEQISHSQILSTNYLCKLTNTCSIVNTVYSIINLLQYRKFQTYTFNSVCVSPGVYMGRMEHYLNLRLRHFNICLTNSHLNYKLIRRSGMCDHFLIPIQVTKTRLICYISKLKSWLNIDRRHYLSLG